MKRQLQGLVFLLSALFFVNAARCGVAGRCVAHATLWLLGSQGVTLLVIGLVVAGVVLSGLGTLLVHGARWMWRTWTKWEPRPVQRAPIRANRVGLAPVMRAAPVAAVAPAAVPAPRISVKRQEVIGGLKYLGYTREEIATVIDRLTGSTEEQLRTGIKMLTGVAA